jgi:hypothetical protein
MPSFLNPLTPYLFWIKLAGVVILCLGSAAAANYVRGNADQVKYSALELSKAKADTKSVQDSLAQLQGFISTMDAAGGDYTAALATIKAQFATIQKELTNALLKPLPADCRPDAGRLRVLTDAVNATRQGAAAAK